LPTCYAELIEYLHCSNKAADEAALAPVVQQEHVA
jgi:hypothetical protein